MRKAISNKRLRIAPGNPTMIHAVSEESGGRLYDVEVEETAELFGRFIEFHFDEPPKEMRLDAGMLTIEHHGLWAIEAPAQDDVDVIIGITVGR